MEKKNRKFSLGQRVLFEGKEYEICYIDLVCKDHGEIYGLAELDAEHKISSYWEECIRDGEMITNNKKISIWVKETEITPVEQSEENEFLTKLGDEWYSLVGYNLLNKNGNVETIVRHNKTGGCKTDVGNHYDLHNIDTPYNMTNKPVKVYAKKPVVESTEEFQIGKWYQCRSNTTLFIKPTSINGKNVTSNVIWSTGRYQEEYTADDIVTDWNLLNDLSIIQEFLPDGHPDKVVVEKTPLEICKEKYKAGMKIVSTFGTKHLLTKQDLVNMYENPKGHVCTSDGFKRIYCNDSKEYAKILEEPEPKSLVGRYLEALVDNPSFARCYKKGDYIEIKKDYGGSVVCTDAMSFGYGRYDWKKSGVELMPEGFNPEDVEPNNTTPKLKVGQWVKIIDKPYGGRPIHWCTYGKMDKYFGQWVQVESLSENIINSAFSVKDGSYNWYFKHSDYTEISDTAPSTEFFLYGEQYKPEKEKVSYKKTPTPKINKIKISKKFL